MFAYIIPGKPVNTDIKQGRKESIIQSNVSVDNNKYLFQTSDSKIDQIAIFLTGVQMFYNDMGASIYISFPLSSPDWKYMGFLSNEKPSEFIKIPYTDSEGVLVVQVGISIEPMSVIRSIPNQNLDISEHLLILEALSLNFYNFVTSFESRGYKPNEPMIPVKAMQEWYENTCTKIYKDKDFMKTLINRALKKKQQE